MNNLKSEVIMEKREKSKWEDSIPSSVNIDWSTYCCRKIERHSLVENTRIIKQFMSDLQVPGWYRGISELQKQAAENLFNAIRDDNEQKTTHRVRRLIGIIGLNPLPHKKHLNILIILCGGSDLAFLWFLFEMLYHKNDQSFTINEQIIFSCIAHLDINFTIRALEKLLPIPKFTNKKQYFKVLEARKAALEKKRKSKNRIYNKRKIDLQYEENNVTIYNKIRNNIPLEHKNSIRRNISNKLPYFMKLNKPKNQISKLYMKLPTRKANLDFLETEEDSNFLQFNEKLRWFKNYEFSPRDRFIHNILRNHINDIVDNFESANLNVKQVNVLCRHHLEIETLQNSLETKLKTFEEKRTIEMSVKYRKQNESYKRVITRLRSDLNKQRNKLHETTLKLRHRCILKALWMNYCNEMNQNKKFYSRNLDEIKFDNITLPSCVINRNQTNKKHGKITVENMVNGRSGTDTDYNKSSKDINVQMHKVGNKQKFPVNSSLLNLQHKYSVSDTDSHSSNCNRKFFKAAQLGRPYCFNYNSIFNCKLDDQIRIRILKAFVEIIDNNISTLSKMERNNLNSEEINNIINISIKNCTDNIWKNKMQKLDEDLRKIGKERTLFPLLEYYDPNNSELMDNMLKHALNILKKDPKYVLASLPQVHRLPILTEWIRMYYGKTYSPKELSMCYANSMPIFRALSNVALSVKLPSMEQLGISPIVKYSCRRYLLKKTIRIRNYHFKNMSRAILAQTRVFYLATRPFQCGSDNMNGVLFAYLPAHAITNGQFRPWKMNECMFNTNRFQLLAKKNLPLSI